MPILSAVPADVHDLPAETYCMRDNWQDLRRRCFRNCVGGRLDGRRQIAVSTAIREDTNPHSPKHPSQLQNLPPVDCSTHGTHGIHGKSQVFRKGDSVSSAYSVVLKLLHPSEADTKPVATRRYASSVPPRETFPRRTGQAACRRRAIRRSRWR